MISRLSHRLSSGGVCALALIFSACDLPTYETEDWTGTIVDGRCEPSVLGSGDRYHVFLSNDEGKKKQLTYQWPEATEMCYQRSEMPDIGEIWTMRVTNPYINPDEGHFYVPQHAEVIDRVKVNP